MSKPRRIDDIERTATMLDLVRCSYPPDAGMAPSHVIIEEVAPGTGWSGGHYRFADALALSVWPSKGLMLDGYEVKASRADLKRELADLTKHEALARYCDSWWLVAWDESVLLPGVPESWGVLLTADGEYGRELVTHRKAAKRTPEPWDRPFVCSLVRNAYQQSPGAAYVARAVAAAHDRASWDAKREEESAIREAVHPLAELIYGKDSWRWPKEARDPELTIRIAAERLTQGTLALSRPA